MTSPIVRDTTGLLVRFGGETYWVDMDVRTMRVTIDLQHHGMMGQPGEVERVGEGVWTEGGLAGRTGTIERAAFDAAEKALGAHLSEAERSRD